MTALVSAVSAPTAKVTLVVLLATQNRLTTWTKKKFIPYV